ncbi:MAG: xylan 1,4-beta-xylosidase, partial [Bacteroidaceae bacterium]|nr:xylan 1,4-beta-xylosidase [Bacteroidaceae bacterium]
MLKTTIHTLILITLLLACNKLHAWEGMEMPRLKVDGKHLKDENGNIVKLHGYAQTFSPWFNEQGRRWNNYDVEGCLGYNKRIIDDIMAAGWKMSFVRMHMDPYWSNTPGRRVKGENDISAFDFNRFT